MKSNVGLYVGFTVFAIQAIATDIYRDHKQREHNKKIESFHLQALHKIETTNCCNMRLPHKQK